MLDQNIWRFLQTRQLKWRLVYAYMPYMHTYIPSHIFNQKFH
jgi:hypothetical protein